MIFLTLFVVMLAACNSQIESTSSEEQPSTIDNNSKLNVKGVSNVDIVNSHGNIEGLEKMTQFYDNAQNGVPSELRIVHYTIEGDPIVEDISYDGETLQVTHDSTRDKFGSGEIITYHCGKLIEEMNPTNTTYIAVDCNDEYYGLQELLQINYNMSQQDLFEFELKYGLNEENEISTSTVDVNIATDVKQEVYKKLVYANYLGEKEFKSSCNNDDSITYNLLVKINGGQREFQWSDCDTSLDGIKFTNIANYIIEQSAIKENVQLTDTVLGYVLKIKDDELLIGEDLTMLDYQWVKDEIEHMNFEHFVYEFTVLEGVDTKEFIPGDKIVATIEGSIIGSKPGRAKVKEINKINLY